MVTLHKQDYSKNKKLYLENYNTLTKVLNKGTPIDHVGSTAIPNIEYGKNIIDILVGAVDELEFREYKSIIESLGFIASVNSSTNIYQFFASRAGETTSQDVHIHLSIIGTERYQDFITLRDYLLDNPTEAINYSNHKLELISIGIVERKDYRATKSKYVENLIQKARTYALNKNKKS